MLKALVRGNLDALRACRGRDLIYLPSYKYMYLSLLACLWVRLRGGRVLLRFHDLLPHKLTQRTLSAVLTDCAHTTRYGFEVVMGQRPYLRKQRHWIVANRCQSRPTVAATEVTQAMSGRRNLVFLGQVSHHKGADILLEAFARLAPEYADVALHLVGAGPLETALKERTEELRLQDRVCFWGYRRDAHALLAQAYLYVHPTPPSLTRESFGRGVVEAMSLGIPSVCFPSGALSELVASGRTGLLVVEESAAALAAAIRQFLDDPTFHSHCASQALREYREKYADEVLRARWIEVLAGDRFGPSQPEAASLS
jgi:glycosyltransferase involved in cell wall biosynthesis